MSYHGTIVVLEFMFPLPRPPKGWAYATWLREESQLNRILRYLCQERCVCEKNFFFPEKACVEVLTPRTSECEEVGAESIKEADFT